MRVLVYKTKHGSTKKIAKVINTYIGDCLLMNFDDLEFDLLLEADVIVFGIPIYYGKIDNDVVSFIKKNKEMIMDRNCCLYVTGLLHSEFMKVVNEAFDYELLKDMKVISGLGGALYYPKLTPIEKMILTVMNKISPVIPKEHNKEMYQNFNNQEIEIFANKIKKLDEKAMGVINE